MNKELVDKQQKALQAFAFSYALEDAGLFITASIVSGSSNVKEMDQLMQKEVDKMKADVITDVEFNKMRNQVESQSVSANEGVMGVATNLSNGYMFRKNTNYVNTELDSYMKVTKDDIKRVANKYLVKENRVVLFYLPKKK